MASTSLTDFPALSNPASETRPSATSPLSSVPLQEDVIPFSGKEVSAGPEESGLSLVGYTIGPYPTYGALISSMRKKWSLKGNLQLTSLREGFFLLRFSVLDDFEMALSGAPWFFLEWPFFLQKWSPHPKRVECSSIPIWVRILDLPLCCWTPNGISKIASFIGIPLMVDTPTAQKTRLTFARVCIEVTSKSVLPDLIPISLVGESMMLEVQYEWKPTPCEFCDSLVHPADICPTKPSQSSTAALPSRGKSINRKPRRRSRTRRPPPKSSTSANNLRPPKISTNTATNKIQVLQSGSDIASSIALAIETTVVITAPQIDTSTQQAEST
ncbi:uncharacterized protein LOC110111469 [Dendrobium catenatum]|uniref:DUF4283 domain-containing protein n=1 Tax=Dendrobium catenatum TaxID=906689 RepID=A0A2I0WUN8_9ASPA|nr:uncharacterized protein LOC110111469 [Dendrobium catenatum]PKU79343.1 hypothetical protein MA16_Dca000688 [Dendrobium catenatum]